MNNQDYYNLLNIEKNATEEDIKKAYRNLARQFHPDVNLDKDAEERFKSISEAYTVLSDNEKRDMYDKTGKTNFSDMDKDPNTRGRGMGRCQRPFGGGKCSGLDALFRRRSYHGNKKSGYIPE